MKKNTKSCELSMGFWRGEGSSGIQKPRKICVSLNVAQEIYPMKRKQYFKKPKTSFFKKIVCDLFRKEFVYKFKQNPTFNKKKM
jgi:hypothetical protein